MKDSFANESTILIVDDEDDIREIMKEELDRHFKLVLTASDGFKALEMLKSNQIDCMVIDQRMPVMTGIQLMKNARKACPLMSFVMVTGNSTDQEVLDALDEGLFDVLDKPYKFPFLINRIKNAILLPRLIDILWSNYSLTLEVDQLDNFLKMNLSEQLKVIYAYSGLLRAKAMKRKVS